MDTVAFQSKQMWGLVAGACVLLIAAPVAGAPKRSSPGSRANSGKWEAASPPSTDPRVAEARRACAAGHVERGVDLLASIIGATGDPYAVYNQARCYQQNDRHEEAIRRFREYLRLAPGEDPAEVRRVENFIRELEAQIEAKAKRAGSPPPAAEPSRAAAPSPAVAATAAEPPGSVAPPSQTDTLIPFKLPDVDPPAETPALRMAAHSALAVSVVALAAGGYYSYQVRKIEKELSSSTLMIDGSDAKFRRAEGETAEKRQWFGLGAGAVFMVGAGVMYWLSSSSSETRVGLSLWMPGAGSVPGMSFTGRY